MDIVRAVRITVALRGIARRIAELPPLAILALGWLVVVVYAFPGMMTMDSIQQLQEARSGFYTDGHPPAMAWLWHFVDKVIAGPFGMLVIQTLAFLAGLYLLLRRALAPRQAAVAASLLFVFPPVLAPMAVIWKDCLMAGLFVLGTAALLAGRRSLELAGLAAFVVATAVRYNAPAATLPLVVILFTWLPPAPTWKARIQRYALATAAWLAVTVAALGLGKALTDQPMYIWHSSLALLDTAGTLAKVDTTIPDEQLRDLFAGTEVLVDRDIHAAVRRQYSPIDFEPLIHGDGHLWEVPISGTQPAPAPKREAISRMFWSTVTSHPGAYLAHRAATTRYVLALPGSPVYSPVMMHRLQYTGLVAQLGVGTAWSELQGWMQRKAQWLAKKTPLFRPWMYLVLALVLLPLARRQRDVLALLLSGLGLEASLFVLAPTPDYRYSHWMVVCTCIAVVMLVARRARRATP
jgi:hypothetical protein